MKIGILGGTGLDDPDILLTRSELVFDKSTTRTAANGLPADYGEPLDNLVAGVIEGVECVILARHGRQHQWNPSNVNYRANFLALKQAGCDLVIATHSVGSLIEEYKPRDFILLDQVIDRTQKRNLTYYDNKDTSFKGVYHASFGDPYDTKLRQVIIDASEEIGFPLHQTGTCVAIEGPRFSSRAESLMFKQWGANLVGMTQVPEAQLAKELNIPFVAIAMVTDYDAWKQDAKPVTVQEIVKTLRSNGDKMIKLLKRIIPMIAASNDWKEETKADEGLITRPLPAE